MSVKKLLGERIKRLRKNRMLTQEQFAEMIDIAPRNLSKIEVGESFVSAETLDKIIQALNITAEELFAYEHIKESKKLFAEICNYLDTIKNNQKQLEKIHRLVTYVKENEI